jgi:outer membrane protein OmpA-like peptidoglycan-associated protein
MKKLLLVIGLVQLVSLLSGQSNALLRRQALESESAKDWYSAAQYYQRLYVRDSSNIKVQSRYAETSRLAGDHLTALRIYMKIAAVDNGKRFPLAVYWAGHMLKTKGSYKEAKKWFHRFYKLKLRSGKYDYYRARAKMEMEACDLAQVMKKNPVLPKLDHLDGSVNTKASEYAPFETDSTLYFSTLRYPEKRDPSFGEPVVFGKIYKTTRKREKWLKIKPLDTLINANRFNNGNLSYGPGEKMMVMSRCVALNATDYQCELYGSRLVSNRWEIPWRFTEPVNEPGSSSTQPHLAMVDTSLVLFFSSNRPGGEGGMDIWYAVADKEGNFGKPVNAGKKVNSPEDELTPWFVSGEKKLYFSSSHHKGLGGLDIFRSDFSLSAISAPENAGYPINSGHNDLYYSVNENYKRAYLASNRPGAFSDNKNNCCNDIYAFRFDTAAVKSEVAVDSTLLQREQMKLLVPLTLYFHNDEPDPKTTATVTTKSYDETFSNYIKLGDEYLLQYSSGLKKQEKQLAENHIFNFFTDSVEMGMEGLERFTTLLQEVLGKGETVRITMKGYCSPLASTSYNINLAKRRISSLKNYFMTTRSGALAKYINAPEGAPRIILEEVEVGELPASKVSDSFKDKRNSVYSPFAASERKIQIIAVSFR